MSGPQFAAHHGLKYQTFATWLQKRKRATGAYPVVAVPDHFPPLPTQPCWPPHRSRPRPHQNRRSQTGQRRPPPAPLASQSPVRTPATHPHFQPQIRHRTVEQNSSGQTDAGSAGMQPARDNRDRQRPNVS
ncbi:hypothetical protein [Luteolibacter pohnpeiensis]|uniref:hypothetical protein n=1 Tax=Luteolibacter pohnpeiensis TaxID=454153 RepID=UPI003CCCBA18